MDILITYDIAIENPADERRLTRVAKICEGFGLRVQYSVFECRLSDTQYERFIGQILGAIERHRDSVNVYKFHGPIAEARTHLGRPPAHTWGDPFLA